MKCQTLTGMTCHHTTLRLGCATAACLLTLQVFAKDSAKDEIGRAHV